MLINPISMHLPTLSKAKALDNLQQPSVDGARHRRNPKTCKLMVLQNFIGPFLVFAPWFSSLNLTEVPLTSYSISNIPSLSLSLSVQHNIVIFWKINKRTNSSFRHKKNILPNPSREQNRESLPLVPTIPRRRRPKPKFESPDRPSSWDPPIRSRFMDPFEDYAWG